MSSSRSAIAVSVRGLGKRYRLEQNTKGGVTTLAESILSVWNAGPKKMSTDFWANRDISFDLYSGEVVGVVGRNGAGKSTLLKLLSRITEPTEGEIDLYGRVGSLLEVGTGFHPELTGRENIFLNGAILGMTRAEIVRKFDEIVAFAEIEPFLDTPVKRFSSGMYVRLAFAVAAHLNPEILIVDEVLAVGDAAFQRKCLGKMQDVAQSDGRTVLFVSHNMAAVRSLCSRALLLKQGTLALDDDADTVAGRYLSEFDTGRSDLVLTKDESRSPDFYLRTVRVLDNQGALVSSLDLRHPFLVEFAYTVVEPIVNLRVKFGVQTADGILVCYSDDPYWSQRPRHLPGDYVLRCQFPPYCLNEGRYLISVMVDVPNDRVLQETEYALSFTVADIEGHGINAEKLPGILRPALVWSGTVTS